MEEGRKDRPAVVTLVTKQTSVNSIEVTVLPITHRPPDDPKWAIEILPPVKRHLGLGNERSWIVVAEGNEFLWPDYDLRRAPGADRYDYGFLPPRFFEQILKAFEAFRRLGAARLSKR